MSAPKLSDLIGRTFTRVAKVGEDELHFEGDDAHFKLWHCQDCCENVTIESVVGDLSDLVGEPILLAEEVTHDRVNPEGVTVPEFQDSFTWTFYKFATRKGYVDVRWYGDSNGYYSESVHFARVSA
jgi:hypothetical protein